MWCGHGGDKLVHFAPLLAGAERALFRPNNEGKIT